MNRFRFDLNSSVSHSPLIESGGGGSSPGPGSSTSGSGAASSPSSPSPTTASPSTSPSSSPAQPSPSGTPGSPPAPSGGEAPQQLTDFEAIFSGMDSPEPAPAPAQTPVAAPAVPTVPVAQPAQQPPVAPQAQPEPVQPVAQPTAGQPGAQTPQAQSPPLDPADPGSLLRALREHESASIDHVAQTVFQLSREDLEALETDVAGTVPKLLARAFVKSQMNLLAIMERTIPAMMERRQGEVARDTDGEDKFFARWKDSGLNKAEHSKAIRDMGIMYRRMFPQATFEQMVEDIGQMALVRLKPRAAQTAPGALVPPVPQTNPMQVNGSHPPQSPPFVPAMGSPGAVSTQQEPEAWAAMFEPQPGA